MRWVSFIIIFLSFLFYIIQPLKADQEKEQISCQIRILKIDTEPGKAKITLQVSWQNKIDNIDKKDLAVVFLFQPKLVYKLSREILALDYNYVVNLLAENINCKMTELSYKENNESKYGGALLYFYTTPDSSIDLSKSCEKEFIIPIQAGSLKTGEPTIMGTGTLCVSIFKKDDPDINHLKSKNYKQLSNVASTFINLRD